MTIAARIMRGDNVPQSDKNFLIMQSPGLFMMAMSSRNPNNENPTDYDALVREENISPFEMRQSQNSTIQQSTQHSSEISENKARS